MRTTYPVLQRYLFPALKFYIEPSKRTGTDVFSKITRWPRYQSDVESVQRTKLPGICFSEPLTL
jgi:hypothetical protein